MSKLGGEALLMSMLSLEGQDGKWSLTDLSAKLSLSYGISISKQSLDERFNKRLVSYCQLILSKIIEQSFYKNSINSSCGFNRILIKDSTCYQLPAHLSEHYPGSGGGSSPAGARIQFEYDLLTSQVNEMSLNPFNVQDIRNSSETLDKIEPKDLIIRDLGYIKTKILAEIEQRDAYYLCRLPVTTNIYEKIKGEHEFKCIDLVEQYKKMIASNLSELYLDVFLGAEKHPTQLYLEIVPDEVYEQRMRKARKIARKKKRNLRSDRKHRNRFNLMLTNVPKEMLPTKTIRKIYGIRWQIELIFKMWKSYAHLDNVKRIKLYRFETLIYLRLIRLALIHLTTNTLMNWAGKKTKVQLSRIKIFKALIKNFNYLKRIAQSSIRHVQLNWDPLIQTLLSTCKFERKKGKIPSYELIKILS